MTAEHNTAHKPAQENMKQVLRNYLFPNMKHLASGFIGFVLCQNTTDTQQNKY